MDYSKITKWFTTNGYDNEDEDDIDENGNFMEQPLSIFEPKSGKTNQAVQSLGANKDGHLVIFEPRSFSEASDIADYLKNRIATVINLHRLQKEQSKRIIDFLSGVIYAIDGDIQPIGPKIFLCSPKNFNVSGSISISEEDKGE